MLKSLYIRLGISALIAIIAIAFTYSDLLSAQTAHSGPIVESPARTEVEKLIHDSGADVAVVFRTLDGKQEMMIEPDVAFHAASTMKIPVMIELFAEAHDGKLRSG